MTRLLVDTQDRQNNKLITLEEGKAFLLTLLDLEEELDDLDTEEEAAEWQEVADITSWEELDFRLLPFEYYIED